MTYISCIIIKVININISVDTSGQDLHTIQVLVQCSYSSFLYDFFKVFPYSIIYKFQTAI